MYGAAVGEVTATSAVIVWSTTVEVNASVAAVLAGQEPDDWDDFSVQTPAAIVHATTLTGLEPGRDYWVRIRVLDGNQTLFADLFLTTLSEIDDTPPEVLNLAVEVITGGWSFRVTWYTDEATTELIEVGGQTFTGDLVALRKNHDMTITPYPELVALQAYTLKVTVVDASGNANSSSVEFTIAEEEAASPLPDEEKPNGEDPGGSEEGTSQREVASEGLGDLLAQPVVQIVLMLGVLFVVLAFVRSRRGDGGEQW